MDCIHLLAIDVPSISFQRHQHESSGSTLLDQRLMHGNHASCPRPDVEVSIGISLVERPTLFRGRGIVHAKTHLADATITMSKLTSLQVLLIQEIKDLYSAENQLVKALPKMARAASSQRLKEAFTTHLEETKGHAARLEQAAEILGASPKGKVCKAMKGLVEEGAETIQEEGDPTIKDLALIGAAQRVEHYEIAGYGAARALAEALQLKEIVELLQTTLDEESTCDNTLTTLSEELIGEVGEVVPDAV